MSLKRSHSSHSSTSSSIQKISKRNKNRSSRQAADKDEPLHCEPPATAAASCATTHIAAAPMRLSSMMNQAKATEEPQDETGSLLHAMLQQIMQTAQNALQPHVASSRAGVHPHQDRHQHLVVLQAWQRISETVHRAEPVLRRVRAVIRIQSLARGFLTRQRWLKYCAVAVAGFAEVGAVARSGVASAATTSISSYGGGLLAALRDWMNLESRYVSALEIMAVSWTPVLVPLFAQKAEQTTSTSATDAAIRDVLASLPNLFQLQTRAFSELMDAIPILSSAEGNAVHTFHLQLQTLYRLLEHRRTLILQQTGICRCFNTLSRILETRRAADAALDHLLKTGGSTAADAKNPLRSLDVLDILVEPFNFFPKLRFALERIVSAFLSVLSPVRSADHQSRALALAWGGFSCAIALAISYHRASSTSAGLEFPTEHPFDHAPERALVLNGTQVSIQTTVVSASSVVSPSSLSLSASVPSFTSPHPRICLFNDRMVITPSSTTSPIIFSPLDNMIMQIDPVPASEAPLLCVWGAPTSSTRHLCMLMHFSSELARSEFIERFLEVRRSFCMREAQRWETITSCLHRLMGYDAIQRSDFYQLLMHAGTATHQLSRAAADWELLLSSLSMFRDPFLPTTDRGHGLRTLGVEKAVSPQCLPLLRSLILLIRKTWLSRTSGLTLHEMVGFITPWLLGRAFLDAESRQTDSHLRHANQWLLDQVAAVQPHLRDSHEKWDGRHASLTPAAMALMAEQDGITVSGSLSMTYPLDDVVEGGRFEELHTLFQPPDWQQTQRSS